MSRTGIAGVFLAALSLSACGLGGQSAVQKAVLAKLENPDGAIFRNEKPGRNGTTCGEVNSKNGAGEFTGFRRYLHVSTMTLISPGEPDFVAVLSGRRPAVDTATACTFAITWTALCTDPSQRAAETIVEHHCDLYGDPDRENQLKAELGIR